MRSLGMVLVTAALQAVWAVAASTQQDTLTLSRALALARQNSPELAATAAGVRAASGRRISARSAGLPRLTADALYLRYPDPPSVSLGPLGSFAPFLADGYLGELRVVQPLYAGGRIAGARRAAEHAEAVAISMREQAEVEVTARVAHAHDDALLAGALLSVAQQGVEVLEAALRVAGEHYAAGTAARLDVLRAETRLSSARLAVREAEAVRTAAREALAAVIGIDPSRAPEVAGSLAHTELSLDSAALTVRVREERPDVAALRARAEMQEALARQARAGTRPSAALYLSGLATRPELVTGREEWSWDWLGGILVTWPLLDFGATRGEVEAARAEGDRANAEAAGRVRHALATLRARLREIERSRLDVAERRENVARAERALGIAQERYADGIGIQLEVLEAEADLSRARADLLRGFHASRSAAIELRRAAGLPADAALPHSAPGGG